MREMVRFKIVFLPEWGSSFAGLIISLYVLFISNNLISLDVDKEQIWSPIDV